MSKIVFNCLYDDKSKVKEEPAEESVSNLVRSCVTRAR